MGMVPFGQLPLFCQVWNNTDGDDSFLVLVASDGKVILGFIWKIHKALYYMVSIHVSLVKYQGKTKKVKWVHV